MKKKISIKREPKEFQELFLELKDDCDELIFRVSDWEENFPQSGRYNGLRLPKYVEGSRAVVTSRSQILDFANSIGIELQPYRLTREEGNFWIAKKIHEMEDEDIYNKPWDFRL